jgi:hypothetical protein
MIERARSTAYATSPRDRDAVRPLPDAPERVTDAWLTDVLRAAGAPRDVSVSAHTVEVLPVQGAAGIVARFRLQYEGDAPGAPRSVVGKFAASYGPIRALIHQFGAYGREVQFYRHFGADPGIPTPRCYCAEIDDATGAFVLLFEDLGDARVREGLEGSVEDTETAVRHLAPFHARWWGDARLRELAFLHHPGTAADEAFFSQARIALTAALPVARERFGSALPETLVVVGERLAADFDALRAARLNEPTNVTTLVHGDFHPGQIFFPSEKGGRFAVFDWQTVSAGNGGDDLARIITTGLTNEQRRAHESRLIRLYHELLVEHGVRGFGFDRCVESYRLGLLTSVALNIIAGATIDPAFLETFRETGEASPEEMMFGWLADAVEEHDVAALLAV